MISFKNNSSINLIDKWKSFTKVYPPFVFVIGVIGAFICHGAMLFSDVIGLDMDLMIKDIELYGGQGRQGILWIRNILQIAKCNLYLTESLTFLFLILSAVAVLFFLHIFSEQEKEKPIVGALFMLIWIVSPFWTVQLYFLSQSVPVLVATILIPVAVLLVQLTYENFKKRWWMAVCAVALMQLIFSTYQIEILLYVLLVVVALYLLTANNSFKFIDVLKWVLFQAAVFFVGFVIYRVIYKLFFNEFDDYLSGQIMWAVYGTKNSVKNILRVVRDSIKGGDFYNITYVPVCLLLFATSLINMSAKKRTNAEKIIRALMLIVIFAVPYTFVILCGVDVVPRMKYLFAIVEAICIYLLASEFISLWREGIITKKKVTRVIAIAMTAILCLFFAKDIINNADYSNRLYYTEKFVYEHDKEIARKIQNDLKDYIRSEGLSNEQSYNRLVFLGTVPTQLNEICVTDNGAAMGVSFWVWGANYSFVRDRIYKFMDCCGYSIGHEAMYSEGAELFYHLSFADFYGEEVESMPSYPTEGYIKNIYDEELNVNFLVVKLGRDWRREIDAWNWSN